MGDRLRLLPSADSRENPGKAMGCSPRVPDRGEQVDTSSPAFSHCLATPSHGTRVGWAGDNKSKLFLKHV